MPAWLVLLTRSGCRVTMAAIPPPKAYAAQINARRRANEPNTSSGTLPIPRPEPGLTYCFSVWQSDQLRRFPPEPPRTWTRTSPEQPRQQSVRLLVYPRPALAICPRTYRAKGHCPHNLRGASCPPLREQNPRGLLSGECCPPPPFRQHASGVRGQNHGVPATPRWCGNTSCFRHILAMPESTTRRQSRRFQSRTSLVSSRLDSYYDATVTGFSILAQSIYRHAGFRTVLSLY